MCSQIGSVSVWLWTTPHQTPRGTGIRALRVRVHLPRAQCGESAVFFPCVPGGDARTVSISWSGLWRSTDVVCRLWYPAGTRLACHWRSVKLLQDAAGPILSAWPLLTVTVTFSSAAWPLWWCSA